MRQLKSTVVIVLFLTFLLILNTITILIYRDNLLSFEKRKDNMLNLTTKYETLPSMLQNNAMLYLSTKNEKYHTRFHNALNTYYNLDVIPIGSQGFTGLKSLSKSDEVYSSLSLTMKAQTELLAFNEKEFEAYQEFSTSFKELLVQMETAVDKKDLSMINSASYQRLYAKQYQILLHLHHDYMNRVDAKEDLLITNQALLEITLIFLSVLLFLIGLLLFYLLIKENAQNSYFRKLYTTIVENINVGLSIQDQEGRYQYMNPKYKELLKVNCINPMNQRPNQLFSSEIAALIEACGPQTSEGDLKLHIDNEDRHICYNHFIIFDENKQKKYIDLLHDTTQTVKMQQQLQQQLKEIQFHSRAKDAFLANISHEIKTPINAIIGMTYFLKGTQLSQKQNDFVFKIENASNLLLGIINDVLDLSKIKANALNFYPTAFKLSSVLQNVEDMFVSQINRKGLAFETHYNFDPMLYLYLDHTRLLQVLVNMMTNAYKFTKTGHIILSAEVKSETTDTINLQFCVEDSGIGILKQDMEKLFHEFEQLENHLTKKHTGTGLGLSICKHIVEKMGGKVWVSSISGVGSKFYFSIPAPKASKQQIEAIEEVHDAPKKFDGQGAKVLLVEDNEINQEVAISLLTEVHLICDTAKDGLEAIEVCKKHPPDYYDLILMDIHMPRMDGYTASNILRNELHIPSPILAVTATSLDEKTKLQYRGIISEFILKPFKIETFYSTIYKFLPKVDKDEKTILTACSPSHELKNKTELAHHKENNSFKNPFSGKEEAIKNLGGLEKAYYKHVTKFQKNYCKSADEIQEFLENGNQEEAKRLAHSVKGLAGTLGMSSLHQAATILDRNISEESMQTNASLEQYRKELKAVINADPYLI